MVAEAALDWNGGGLADEQQANWLLPAHRDWLLKRITVPGMTVPLFCSRGWDEAARSRAPEYQIMAAGDLVTGGCDE